MSDTYPLAWGRDGEPIDLPSTAAGWRVRRSSSSARGGGCEVIYHDGVPLIAGLETTADELRELVSDRPGKYRLDAVDESGKSVSAPPAYAVLGGDGAGHDGDPMTRTLECVERLVRTQAEAMDKMCAQLSSLVEASARLVAAADSAGVTKRPPPPLAEVTKADDEDAEATPSPWVPLIEQLAPQIPSIVNAAVAWASAKVANGTNGAAR